MAVVHEPTAEELMLKFLAPVKLEFRIKKVHEISTNDAVSAPSPVQTKTEEDAVVEAEDLIGKDSANDSKRRKDNRGQNRDSKRHKSYETVQSMRSCKLFCMQVLEIF